MQTRKAELMLEGRTSLPVHKYGEVNFLPQQVLNCRKENENGVLGK